ncbi:MAG: iron-containing alcohol dehydrogenase [Armatimonadetes bacterium]|nr:iron-containing alcohol dehydrogenase [Armatimonadota bacterium]
MKGKEILAAQQWTMSLPAPVEFGAGCVDRIVNYTRDYKRALIVTGKRAMKESRVTDRVCGLLDDSGVRCRVFAGASPDPVYTEVEAAASMAKEFGADIIIGIGGGSAIDTAKAAAVSASHEGHILEYRVRGSREITSAVLPTIAITATSGTGSHIGRASVIADDERGLKHALISDYLFPKVAFCDPEILRTMPAYVTAASGFDAFSHALEGYLSVSEDPFGNLCAKEAIKIITRTLPRVYRDGDNLDLRAEMAWADTLAGVSLATNAIITAHALTLALGKRYGIAHGAALACIMPACLAHSRNAAAEKLADVARLMGCAEDFGTESLADRAIEEVERLISSIGLDKSLTDYGFTERDMDSVVEDSLTYFSFRMNFDPAPVDHGALVRILRGSA